MRTFLHIVLYCPFLGLAQPGPPSVCFVLAEEREALRPLEREVQVVQHYRERVPYVGFDGSWLRPEEESPLQGGPLFRDSTQRWIVYHPIEGMAESYLLIAAGTDTMRIDLPEDPSALIDRAWSRCQRDTPEVIRFRKGRYAVEELVADPRASSAAHKLAKRLIAEDEAMHQKDLAALEEYYRNQPPPVPPALPSTPPPPMTEQDWTEHWAKQPPLKQALIDRMNADTVWVRLSGRVMLNGGCGSGMPLVGLEMRTDTGWVERIPFDPIQMDCGMPWADWEDHIVMLPPLRSWVASCQPPGKKELLPGRYRLFFIGGNNERRHTAGFTLDR